MAIAGGAIRSALPPEAGAAETPSHLLDCVRELLDDPAAAKRELVDALFGRELRVPAMALDERLAERTQEALISLGLIRRVAEGVEPLARLDRVGDLLVASDLRRHRRHRDFVVGPGPASHLLARHTRPVAGRRALDLGCGSGIQSLLLALAGMTATAVDINGRALAYTRCNAALNRLPGITAIEGDFLVGDLDAALDGRFDVVVANPPFVLAPVNALTYRDRPLPGDEVTWRTLERAARALSPGGRGYVLGNWIDRTGHWAGPVRAWLRDAGLSGAALRVASHEPDFYAAVWTRDLPPAEREAATRAWAAALISEGIDRIHVGVVMVAGPGDGRVARFDHANAADGSSWMTLEQLLGA